MYAWTKMHLYTWVPSLIVMFFLAWVLAKKMKNKDEFLKMLPVRIIAVVLVIMEIFKQWLSVKVGYNLYHLPFHFCSMFVFLFPVFSFYNGKYKSHIRAVTVVACFMLLMFMVICPNTIYSDLSISDFFIDFFSFHTVAFHNIVIFGLLYILFVGLYTLDTRRDHKTMFVVFSIYCAIACVMSQVFKENFNSFYTCRISVVEEFRLFLVDKIGWVAQLIYVVCLWIVTVLFGILCYWIFRGILNIINKLKRDN